MKGLMIFHEKESSDFFYLLNENYFWGLAIFLGDTLFETCPFTNVYFHKYDSRVCKVLKWIASQNNTFFFPLFLHLAVLISNCSSIL